MNTSPYRTPAILPIPPPTTVFVIFSINEDGEKGIIGVYKTKILAESSANMIKNRLFQIVEYPVLS